jgi:hypothetical protein
MDALAQNDSAASKLVKDTLFVLNKWQSPFINCVKQLLKSDNAVTAEMLLGNDQELIFGILLQNALHPKNSNRVEAIKSNSY